MKTPAAKTFTAVLERANSSLRWVFARVPFDIEKVWPVRNGLRVRGEIEGFPFRTALFPDPVGEGRAILVNKKMQAGARAKIGSKVTIRIEPDLEERPAEVPAELAKALKEDRRLRKWFDGLGFGMRRYIGNWVKEPKSAASRAHRADRVAEWLLLALEGELELPPILRAAFQRQPQAEAGWMAMTKVRRRNHLLGIFHLQSRVAQEKRVKTAVEDALMLVKRAQNPLKIEAKNDQI